MALIIPKCNAEESTLNLTLQVYYDADDWVENSTLIDSLSSKLIDAGIENEKKEPQSYTKKTQVLSYYGLLEWEDAQDKQSRRRISENGRKFYELRDKKDKDGVQALLIEILGHNTFGRNVLGCDSDSDLEAPNIFLKSCFLLGSITNKEFAYILGKMELDGKDLGEALFDVQLKRNLGQQIELSSSAKKWSDPKPILALADWGLFTIEYEGTSKIYHVENNVIKHYSEQLLKLQIRNTVHSSGSGHGFAECSDEEKSTVLSYLAALRTKPFLLLAGISGTGKSRIVRKLAQATVTQELQGSIDDDFEEKRWDLHRPKNFELIQVKPNWHTSTDVVGFLSSIPTPHYVFTPFVEFVARAWQYPEIPFFLCLDEMNLAPVEEYFAEFLSAIESRDFDEDGKYVTDPIIKPFKTFGEKVCDEMIDHLFPGYTASKIVKDPEIAAIVNHLTEKGLTLPKNLMVIGTVNMDETTFSFSRKVLDRAMSIEMNEVDYDSFFADQTDDAIKSIVESFDKDSLNDLLVNRNIKANNIVKDIPTDSKQVVRYLKRINTLLEDTPFKLGYRAANEAIIYLRSSQEFGREDWAAAMDEFTVMKILSRLEGDDTKLKISSDDIRLGNAEISSDTIKGDGNGVDITLLSALRVIIKDEIGEMQAYKKLTSMIDQLSRNHFVSYWN